MLDLKILAPPLKPAAEELDVSDGRFEYLANLVLKGHYDDAASRAEELLNEGYCDIRVICYFLLGVFRQDGVGCLPRLSGTLTDLITTQIGLLSPYHRREREIDRSLVWLFNMITTRLDVASRELGETWQRWVASAPPSSFDRASLESQRLATRLRQLNVQSPAAQSLDVLTRWLTTNSPAPAGKLAGSVPPSSTRPSGGTPATPATPVRQPAALPQVEIQEDDEDENSHEDDDSEGLEEPEEDKGLDEPGDVDEDGDDGNSINRGVQTRRQDEGNFAPAAKLNTQSPIQAEDKPRGGYLKVRMNWHLMELVRKMDLMQKLAGEGDLLRASIVTRDLEENLSHFDPRLYFPELFVPYYRVVAATGASQEMSRESAHPAVLAALEQLYRLDEDSFCSVQAESEE